MESCYRRIHFLKKAVTKMKTVIRKLKKIIYGKCPGLAGSFPYLGTKVYFPKNSLIFYMAYEQGIFESENVSLLSQIYKPDTIYFDVGANIGLLSIPLLTSQPHCKVVSFEASPNTLPYLLKTAENSAFRKRWLVIGKAVGESLGSASFTVSSSDVGAFDGFEDTKRAGATKKVTVPVTTIDYEWELMGTPRVSVIKVDVEGAELQVLKGAQKCISRERPFILIEWNLVNLNAYQCKPEQLLLFADAIGYQIFSVPTFVPVANSLVLRAQMFKTENFLLFPK